MQEGAKSELFKGWHICLEQPLSASMGDTMGVVTNNGGEWCNMNKSTKVVVSNAWNNERRAFKFAVKYGVPVVTDAWLYACVAANNIAPFDPYVVAEGETKEVKQAASAKEAIKKRAERKRKAKDEGEEAKAAGGSDGGGGNDDDDAAMTKAKKALDAAAKKPAACCKGAPGYPNFGLVNFFEASLPGDDMSKDQELMKALGAYMVAKVPDAPVVKLSCGRVKVPLPDLEAHQLPQKELDALSEAVKELAQYYFAQRA
eukprot:m.202151 g.202151  ORF g.202151 m.202151 type:complete len:258 (-) comp21951_c0_seq1:48-821(-)